MFPDARRETKRERKKERARKRDKERETKREIKREIKRERDIKRDRDEERQREGETERYRNKETKRKKELDTWKARVAPTLYNSQPFRFCVAKHWLNLTYLFPYQVTQYECGNEYLGGWPGCLQFFTGTSGTISR
jgi:hypothetical protein